MSHYKYDRLSAQDASFLVFETPNAPMHVAGMQIFEAGPLRTAEGGIDIERIREATRAVLHLVPRYCQKLAWIPYFDHPVWVDDRDFNLDYHIRHTSLPRPGGKAQLRGLVSRVVGQRLDRARPLWETWVVEGLEGDRFALVTKIHHCMIDGQRGVDLSHILLSTSPDATGFDGDAPPFIPHPAPRPRDLFFDELVRRAILPVRVAHSVQSVVRKEGSYQSVATRARAVSEMLSWLLNARSDTPLNGTLSPHRRFDWLATSLDETKAVRRALDCTVNDVVLAVATGAIREFLLRRHVRPERIKFRVSAPVNVRGSHDDGRFGNRVSSWIVDLPVDAGDPLERLRRISAQTRQLKESRAALGVEMMMAATELAPRLLLPFVARASSLPINMVVTNVPGPQFPLYMFGARMDASYPLVPLLEGTGLGIALLSYDGKLCWGVNADYAMVPDLSAFCAGIERSFAQLKELAGVSGAQGSIAILTQPSARAAKTS
jgi:WS/DGAT/MGAT family acyltransferase